MKTIRVVMLAGVLTGACFVGGCGGESKSEWSTLSEGDTPEGLREMIDAADWRAVSYLSQKGNQSPITALQGYDRTYTEGTMDGKKTLSVLYIKKVVPSDMYLGMRRFRVLVDEDNKAVLVEGN